MRDSSSSSDVVVIGGGVIGLAVAWRAAQRGLRVVVLERGEPGSGTSHFAAGMLAPVSEATFSEQSLLALGLAAARLYPEFVAELSEAADLDPGHLQCGTLAVARDGDEAAWLERELELRRRLSLPAVRLRGSEARRLEPGLAPGVRLALEFPGDHVIDPRRLVTSLAQAMTRAGGQLRQGSEVRRVLVADDRVTGVELCDGRRVHAPQVVIAAGVWSDELEGIPDGGRVPIRPVKGQILRLHDPAGPGLLTRILRVDGGYIAPRGDGRYVVGATMEERGFDTTATAGATFELLREAIELVPGVSELVIDELGAGLRPATPDNKPAIGAGAVPGLFWATGHYRNGILLAPLTAEFVSAALSDEPAEELAIPFAPARFAGTKVPAWT